MLHYNNWVIVFLEVFLYIKKRLIVSNVHLSSFPFSHSCEWERLQSQKLKSAKKPDSCLCYLFILSDYYKFRKCLYICCEMNVLFSVDKDLKTGAVLKAGLSYSLHVKA
jgi:hypothetical protein